MNTKPSRNPLTDALHLAAGGFAIAAALPLTVEALALHAAKEITASDIADLQLSNAKPENTQDCRPAELRQKLLQAATTCHNQRANAVSASLSKVLTHFMR